LIATGLQDTKGYVWDVSKLQGPWTLVIEIAFDVTYTAGSPWRKNTVIQEILFDVVASTVTATASPLITTNTASVPLLTVATVLVLTGVARRRQER
jgi:hypothetical protein